MVKAWRSGRKKAITSNLCKNPLPELPLVQGADSAAHNVFCFLLFLGPEETLKHTWSDLQVANCGRFAAQLKDIVTG